MVTMLRQHQVLLTMLMMRREKRVMTYLEQSRVNGDASDSFNQNKTNLSTMRILQVGKIAMTKTNYVLFAHLIIFIR
jgi:hypothetical protein